VFFSHLRAGVPPSFFVSSGGPNQAHFFSSSVSGKKRLNVFLPIGAVVETGTMILIEKTLLFHWLA